MELIRRSFSTALVISLLIAVFGVTSVKAYAAPGPPVTFTPGTGPIGSTLLIPEQFAALPPDIQSFMSSHRVGDTWSATLQIAVDPSQPLFPAPGPQSFFGWTNASGCYTADDCDIYTLRLDVGYAGLGWWTRATSGAQGNRTAASGISVTDIQHQLRHHWVSHMPGGPPSTDFSVVVTPMQAAGDTVNVWWRSGETSGTFQFVSWFNWSLVNLPGVGPVLIPTSSPGYYATFIASQQSQITDSASRVTNKCVSQSMETLTWITSGSLCPYPSNPLP